MPGRASSVVAKYLVAAAHPFKPAPIKDAPRYGYNSYGVKWRPLAEIKQYEVVERGNEWFDDTGLDLHKTTAIWVTEDPRDAVLYDLSSDFRNIVDDFYKGGKLPAAVPEEYVDSMTPEEYSESRRRFLNAPREVTRVPLAGALPAIEDQEAFGKAYLFINPIPAGGGA